jgi:hypothetical protein
MKVRFELLTPGVPLTLTVGDKAIVKDDSKGIIDIRHGSNQVAWINTNSGVVVYRDTIESQLGFPAESIPVPAIAVAQPVIQNTVQQPVAQQPVLQPVAVPQPAIQPAVPQPIAPQPIVPQPIRPPVR